MPALPDEDVRLLAAALKIVRFVSLLALGLAVWNAAAVVHRTGLMLGIIDPVSLAEYRLYAASSASFVSEIERAIADGDHDTAVSLYDLALRHGHPLPADLRERAEGTWFGRVLVTGSGVAKGFVFGSLDSGAEIAGSVTSDLIGVGDARDFSIQGLSYLKGEGYDPVLLGLSAVGIGLTVSTFGTAGASALPDTGLSVLKNAYRAGRISRPLRTYLAKNASGLVNTRILKAELAAAVDDGALGVWRLKTVAARSVDARLAASLADDAAVLGAIRARGGMRSALAALSIADGPKDLRKLQRVSAHFGDGTFAAMKFLGRGMLEVGTALYAIASAIAGALLAALLFVGRLVIRITVRLFSRSARHDPSRRTVLRAALRII